MSNELSEEERAALIDYALRKFGEERWTLSIELRPVRIAIEKLRATMSPAPTATVVSLRAQREKRR
jgi:hypothetical protein